MIGEQIASHRFVQLVQHRGSLAPLRSSVASAGSHVEGEHIWSHAALLHRFKALDCLEGQIRSPRGPRGLGNIGENIVIVCYCWIIWQTNGFGNSQVSAKLCQTHVDKCMYIYINIEILRSWTPKRETVQMGVWWRISNVLVGNTRFVFWAKSHVRLTRLAYYVFKQELHFLADTGPKLRLQNHGSLVAILKYNDTMVLYWNPYYSKVS